MLKVTAEHPIWSFSDGGWTSVGSLDLGEYVDALDGKLMLSSMMALPELETVYNLEVEHAHTYFVGATGVWVHNQCGNAPKARNRPPGPDPLAEGRPHARVERPGRDGLYTTHNGDGTYKQYRGSGKPHGKIERPNVKEDKVNRNGGGREFISSGDVRPPEAWEVPGGS